MMFRSVLWLTAAAVAVMVCGGAVGEEESPRKAKKVVETPEVVLTLKVPNEAWLFLFGPDSQRIVVQTNLPHTKHSFFITDLTARHLSHAPSQGHYNSSRFAWSADGKRLVVGYKEYDWPTLAFHKEHNVNYHPVGYVTGEGPLFIYRNTTRTTYWRTSGKRWAMSATGEKDDPVTRSQLSADGVHLAVARRKGRAAWWKLGGKKPLAVRQMVPRPRSQKVELREHDTTVTIAPDSKHLIVVQGAFAPQRWQVGSAGSAFEVVPLPKALTSKPRKHPHANAVVAAKGAVFAGGMNSPYPPGAREKDAKALPLVLPSDWTRDSARRRGLCLARTVVSPDCTRAVTRLENGQLALWDLQASQVVSIFPRYAHQVLRNSMVRFSPDGQMLAEAGWKGEPGDPQRVEDTDRNIVRIWQVRGDSHKRRQPPVVMLDEERIGPWGKSLNGVQTRLILQPECPQRVVQWHATLMDAAKIPVAGGAWWRLRLQVRRTPGEKAKELRLPYPVPYTMAPELFEIAPRTGLKRGKQVTFEHDANEVIPGRVSHVLVIPADRDINNYNGASFLLGKQYLFKTPGSYTIRFAGCGPQTDAEGKVSMALPPSPEIRFFFNEPPADVKVKYATPAAALASRSNFWGYSKWNIRQMVFHGMAFEAVVKKLDEYVAMVRRQRKQKKLSVPVSTLLRDAWSKQLRAGDPSKTPLSADATDVQKAIHALGELAVRPPMKRQPVGNIIRWTFAPQERTWTDAHKSLAVLEKMGTNAAPALVALLTDQRWTRSDTGPLHGLHPVEFRDVAMHLLQSLSKQEFLPATEKNCGLLSQSTAAEQKAAIAKATAWWKKKS
jgi:hypothetical protein